MKGDDSKLPSKVAYDMQHNCFEMEDGAGGYEPAVLCSKHGWTPGAPRMVVKLGRGRWCCRLCQDASLKAADSAFSNRLASGW